MKETKIVNQLKLIIMFFAMCISICLFGTEAKAATSGEIPCSEGQVTWTLDENGVLTFSGDGTTKIYGSWYGYWHDYELNEEDVLAVKTETTNGIYLNTCERMFYEFENCTSIDMSGFHTEHVTDMSYMFYVCKSLTQINFSGIDTSNVTNMKYMFDYCIALTQLDLSGFDTSNVTNMSYMFFYCTALTQLDLSGFNTGNVTNMSGMFKKCLQLTNIYMDKSKFNTSKVTAMNEMFYQCPSLQQLDLSGFDTSNVKATAYMFYKCISLSQLDVGVMNTSNVTDMRGMFFECKSLVELNVRGLETNNVTNMSDMFSGCTALKKLELNDFDTSKVTNMSGMFSGCKGIMQLEFGEFDTRNVTDMSNMFNQCESIKEIEVYKLETNSVTNMSYMFSECAALIKLDVSGFDTSNVTDMSCMFRGCYSLPNLDVSSFDTSNVTNMTNMFCLCKFLNKLDLSNFNTEKVTDMSSMFYGCRRLTELNVSSFDTRNVSDMLCMFYKCASVTQLDVSGFDTSNVMNMAYMFNECNSLEKLDISNFNTQKVTNMAYMFNECNSLEKLDISNFNTQNVTSMTYMFTECRSLKQLDLSSFNTQNVTKMDYMFNFCTSLSQLDLSSFNTQNVTRMDNMFYCCSSLSQLDLSSFVIGQTTNTSHIFDGLTDLMRLVTPQTSLKVYFPYRQYSQNSGCWIDTEKNIYSCGSESVISKSIEIRRVDIMQNIKYMTDGELVNCPATYNITVGLSELGTMNHPHGTFAGWYEDEACTIPVTSIAVGTIGDVILYPKLEGNTYGITYMNIDNILNKDELPATYIYGMEMEIPEVKKHCFVFAGWYEDEACTIAFPSITKETSGDLTIYAKWQEKHDIDKENGKVIKAATEEETGIIQYTCKHCTYSITEDIPKIESTPGAMEDAILNSGDNDIKGSSFSLIQARADKTTKNSIRLKWNRVAGADGYMVYGNKCNPKNKYEPIEMIKNGNTTTFTHKNRKKGTYYKYTIYAYKVVDGKREQVAVSKTIHATTKGSKNGNAKSVKVNKSKVSLKKGKTFKLKCSEVAEKGKKVRIHRSIAYESSNTQIATVSKKGVIKGKKKGTCYVYAYAQDGVYKRIKVTVK